MGSVEIERFEHNLKALDVKKEEWLNSVGACIFKARKTRKKLQQTVLQEENLAGHCGGQSEQEPKGGGDEETSKQD